jgi:hypothetical protein
MLNEEEEEDDDDDEEMQEIQGPHLVKPPVISSQHDKEIEGEASQSSGKEVGKGGEGESGVTDHENDLRRWEEEYEVVLLVINQLRDPISMLNEKEDEEDDDNDEEMQEIQGPHLVKPLHRDGSKEVVSEEEYEALPQMITLDHQNDKSEDEESEDEHEAVPAVPVMTSQNVILPVMTLQHDNKMMEVCDEDEIRLGDLTLGRNEEEAEEEEIHLGDKMGGLGQEVREVGLPVISASDELSGLTSSQDDESQSETSASEEASAAPPKKRKLGLGDKKSQGARKRHRTKKKKIPDSDTTTPAGTTNQTHTTRSTVKSSTQTGEIAEKVKPKVFVPLETWEYLFYYVSV